MGFKWAKLLFHCMQSGAELPIAAVAPEKLKKTVNHELQTFNKMLIILNGNWKSKTE